MEIDMAIQVDLTSVGVLLLQNVHHLYDRATYYSGKKIYDKTLILIVKPCFLHH